MNAIALEPVRWSRRRWTYTIGALFIAQVALVLYFSRREPPPVHRPPFHTAVYLAVDAWSSNQLARWPELTDPLLLALPGLRGFSGRAWLAFAPPADPPTAWTLPGHSLPLEMATLGESFNEFVASNNPPAPRLADRPLPPLLRYDPNFPMDPLPPRSRVSVEGELAARPLLTRLELKSWPHTDILSNTTVQAVVDASGLTVSARLLSESGLRQADLYALQLTAGARFQPSSRGSDAPHTNELSWGRLVFHWHTLPLPATNLQGAPP